MIKFRISIAFLAICPTVTITATRGSHFFFLPEEFTKMVGTDRWRGKEFEVIQDGSKSWTGKVEVWSVATGAHGQKVDGYAEGDWRAGDTITLKACSEAGKFEIQK